MSGGVEINFRLMKWRYDLVLGHILPISQPPSPPGNNFTVPYYFIYFFNNLLTVSAAFGGKKGLKSSFHLLKLFCLYIFDQLVVFY